MDTSGDSFYPSSPERRAQAVLMDATAASSVAVADPGMHPVPRGQPTRLGPITAGALVTAGEGQPSAAFRAQRHLFEAEAEKDDLRVQLSSVVSQFRARENWWRVNVTESKNQVIAGVFQNHQFELEARQQKRDNNGSNDFEMSNRWSTKRLRTLATNRPCFTHVANR